ncbi:MAG: class II aldolase/adducin family protein [Chloroflexota bacterium]|nr:class II aldolase/adducin family protein [Chloroflexota bacterium]
MNQVSEREQIEAMRVRLAEVGRFLFDRALTDSGGGNISARVGEVVVMSPSYSGQGHRWQLTPGDFLVVSLDGALLEGTGKITREASVHLGLHRKFGAYGKAVIHAHPRHVMVFAAMAQAMPPVLEATLKFGTIGCIDYAPAHSPDLADRIIAMIEGQEERIAKHAAAVLAPWHGLFLIGKDIDAAFDAVERIDTNAFCILQAQAALGGRDLLAQQRDQLASAVARYRK